MTRKLKVGLALVAVVVLSAVAAGAAQAEYNLTPGVNRAILTGEQIAHEKGNKFEITSRGTRYECKSITGTSTVEGLNVTDATVTGTSSGCTANGELEVNVDSNGCTVTQTGETNAAGQAIGHLLCPAGKAIEATIPALNCTLKIHEQTPTSGGVTATNVEGSPDDIQATTELSGVTYERIGTSVGCVAAAPKEGNDAVIIGKATIRAYEDNNGIEGKQVNLTVS